MVARTKIKSHVVTILSVVSNHPEAQVTDPKQLKRDLGLSSRMIGALAHPYSQISVHYGGKRITIGEAQALKTVKASIDLVYARANDNG